MMSFRTIRQRTLAWIGVIIGIIAVIGLSSAVVIQQLITDHTTNSQSPASAPCSDTSNVEPTYPVPAIYVPPATVNSLQTTDLVTGSGKTASSGECLIVKYFGTLASNGTVFDQNFTGPTAFAFPLGQGQVISGWDIGLQGMRVGGTRRLVIPANLAYGNQSPSAAIPPNSALVFVVKLLRIQ